MDKMKLPELIIIRSHSVSLTDEGLKLLMAINQELRKKVIEDPDALTLIIRNLLVGIPAPFVVYSLEQLKMLLIQKKLLSLEEEKV